MVFTVTNNNNNKKMCLFLNPSIKKADRSRTLQGWGAGKEEFPGFLTQPSFQPDPTSLHSSRLQGKYKKQSS